jgi:tRNA nucleotidyltransferase (CCA-adding enzyme)
MAATPRRMFETLAECGALPRVLPQWPRLDGARALAALDHAATRGFPLPVRYAALFAGGPVEAAESVAARLRAPIECRDLAVLAARWSATVREARRLGADALVELFERADAFRRPDRFAELVDACECDAAAVGGTDPQRLPSLRRALAAAQGVDGGAIAQANPKDVAAAIRAARVAAVANALAARR